jgi:hypothetical protein
MDTLVRAPSDADRVRVPIGLLIDVVMGGVIRLLIVVGTSNYSAGGVAGLLGRLATG